MCCKPSRSKRPASSEKTLQLRSMLCSAALLGRIDAICVALSWSRALHERFRCESVEFCDEASRRK